MNKELLNYLNNEILVKYQKDNSGHGVDHIKTVVSRSKKIAKKIGNLNMNMVITIAYYHDLATIIKRENHEIESAKMFFNDEFIKKFFNDNQRIIMKEAIEDHSASLNREPRSIYGKIVSSADRNCDVKVLLNRCYKFCTKFHPDIEIDELVERCYNHVEDKFGENGYAKMYYVDNKYLKFKKDVKKLLDDKNLFKKEFIKVNKLK